LAAVVADEVVGAADDGAEAAADTTAGEEGGTAHPAGAAPAPAHPDVGEDTSLDWVEVASGARLRTLRLPHPAIALGHRSLERVGVGQLSFPGAPHIPREADGHRRLVKSIGSTNWVAILRGDLRFEQVLPDP